MQLSERQNTEKQVQNEHEQMYSERLLGLLCKAIFALPLLD